VDLPVPLPRPGRCLVRRDQPVGSSKRSLGPNPLAGCGELKHQFLFSHFKLAKQRWHMRTAWSRNRQLALLLSTGEPDAFRRNVPSDGFSRAGPARRHCQMRNLCPHRPRQGGGERHAPIWLQRTSCLCWCCSVYLGVLGDVLPWWTKSGTITFSSSASCPGCGAAPTGGARVISGWTAGYMDRRLGGDYHTATTVE